MKRLLLILLLTVMPGGTLLAAETAPAADPASEPAEATEDEPSGEQAQPSSDDPMTARPSPSDGGLRETVTETMRTFTPSEAIDVDKPVDFPANI